MKISDIVNETATAGATSAGAIATVANPPAARQKIKTGKKWYSRSSTKEKCRRYC